MARLAGTEKCQRQASENHCAQPARSISKLRKRDPAPCPQPVLSLQQQRRGKISPNEQGQAENVRNLPLREDGASLLSSHQLPASDEPARIQSTDCDRMGAERGRNRNTRRKTGKYGNTSNRRINTPPTTSVFHGASSYKIIPHNLSFFGDGVPASRGL